MEPLFAIKNVLQPLKEHLLLKTPGICIVQTKVKPASKKPKDVITFQPFEGQVRFRLGVIYEYT